MPDYRQTRSYQPDLQSDLDAQMQALRGWNPMGGMAIDRGNDPLYSDRYLAGEGAPETLQAMEGSLRNALDRTNAIEGRAETIQGLRDEQSRQMEPLWRSADNEPGLLSRISSGIGSAGNAIGEGAAGLGGALGRGLNAIIPSQNTLNNVGMRLQNMGAAYYGIVPPYMQQMKLMHEMGYQDQQMQLKRAEAARALEARQQEVEQNHWNNALKVVGNNDFSPPQQHAMLTQMGKQGNPVAFDIASNVNAKMLADFKLVKDELDMTPEQIVEGIKTKQINYHDLSAMVTTKKKDMEQRALVTAQERARAKEIDTLTTKFQTDPQSLSTSELKTLQDFHNERKQRALTIQNLQNDVEGKDIELAGKRVMRQYGPEVNLPNGTVKRQEFDPQTGQSADVTGTKPPPISFQAKIDNETAGSLVHRAGVILEKTQDKAVEAIRTIQSAGRIHKILQTDNTNLGPGANIMQYLDRLGQQLNMGGRNQAERIANTRILIQGLAQFGIQARSMLEGGGSISDMEQRLVEKASTGDISEFTPKELGIFIRAIDQQARSVYQLHQDKMKEFGDDPESVVARSTRFYKVPALPPDLPPVEESKAKKVAPSPIKPYDDKEKETQYQEFLKDYKKGLKK